jgi:hypothetical protein
VTRRTDVNIGLISGGQAVNALGPYPTYPLPSPLLLPAARCPAPGVALTFPPIHALDAAEAAAADLAFRLVTPPLEVLAQLEAIVAQSPGVRIEVLTQNGTVDMRYVDGLLAGGVGGNWEYTTACFNTDIPYLHFTGLPSLLPTCTHPHTALFARHTAGPAHRQGVLIWTWGYLRRARPG